MLEINLLSPIIATIFSVINSLLVYINFRNKPWKFKGWIVISMVFWIPWAGFTILLRLANSEAMALLFLQLSFLSTYVTFYALFRFHQLLVLKPDDNRFFTFSLAILMGFNIGLGLDHKYLMVVRTDDNKYWTDHFAPQLFAPHILFVMITGILTYQALRKLDAFSLFYSSDNRNNPIQLLTGASIVGIVGVLSINYFIQGSQQDATAFLILSVAITSLLGGIYGINPISKMLAPQRLWTFFIIGKSGLPVFEYHFSPDEKLGEIALVSAAINASSHIIMDYLGTNEPLTSVDLDERVILLDHYEEITFALIADHTSEQLQIILDEIVSKITKHQSYQNYLPGKGHGKYNYAHQIITDIFESRR